MTHRRTDPVCRRFRRPSGFLTRWWYDRNRGKRCVECRPRWKPEPDPPRQLGTDWLYSVEEGRSR